MSAKRSSATGYSFLIWPARPLGRRHACFNTLGRVGCYRSGYCCRSRCDFRAVCGHVRRDLRFFVRVHRHRDVRRRHSPTPLSTASLVCFWAVESIGRRNTSAIRKARGRHGSNENANGLLRHYFSERRRLSGYSRGHPNKAARQQNKRPRKTLGARPLRLIVLGSEFDQYLFSCLLFCSSATAITFPARFWSPIRDGLLD